MAAHLIAALRDPMGIICLAVIAACLISSANAQESRRDEPAKGRFSGPIRRVIDGIRGRLFSGNQSAPQNTPAPHRDEVPHKLVVLRLSEELFTSFIDREVDEQRPVHDVILGTPVHGQARTTGRPTINLVPHDSQAEFQVVLEGTTVSRTVGQSGPAIIYSHSTTRFHATKQVIFEPGKGFHALPSEIDAHTELVTEGIGSTRAGLIGRIVRRRAAREVQRQQPQALAIVRRNAETRIRSVFDVQLEKGLAQLNRPSDLRSTAIGLLANGSEPRYVCCSTDKYVQVAPSLGQRETLPMVLPAGDRLQSPVQLWIHNSLPGPQIAGMLKRLDLAESTVSQWSALSQTAMAALVGTELVRSATARVNRGTPSPLDITTVEDWTVLEIGDKQTGMARHAGPAAVH